MAEAMATTVIPRVRLWLGRDEWLMGGSLLVLALYLTVTLPGARYGLISATFVIFTLVITDFGVPKVIGGQLNMLATDIYKQVVGQQNFQMGAVVSLILLLPALVAFFVERWAQTRQTSALSSRAVPYQPRPRPIRDLALLGLWSASWWC